MTNLSKPFLNTLPASPEGVGALRVLSRLAGAARFFVGAVSAHKKALQLAILYLLSPAVLAQVPGGTTLDSVVTASYKIGATSYSPTAAVAIITDVTIRFMTPAKTGGVSTPVGKSMCWSAGQLNTNQTDPLAGFPNVSGTSYVSSDTDGGIAAGTQSLVPATAYGKGQTVYLEVVDIMAKGSGTIAVVITGSNPADSEVLELTETGLNTGVFTGAIKTLRNSATSNNCQLSSSIDTKINALYKRNTSTGAAAAAASSSAMVDPIGIVFDSKNGLPVDGATVTLLDANSGLAAKTYCDDGVTASPNPMVSGQAYSECGGIFDGTKSGQYWFPKISPGTYILKVQTPVGYVFPSVDATPNTTTVGVGVRGVPGAGESYGTAFTVNAGDPILTVHIPVDPTAQDLQIVKTAGKAIVGEGENVPYTLTISNETAANTSALLPTGVVISDHLPQGFRYRAGSARLNGAVQADPTISADGRTITFNIGNIAAASQVTLKYVAQVTAGAVTGKAENIAQSGNQAAIASNVARASVLVREDLMRSRAILMGRVIIGSCDGKKDNDKLGLQNARILLEDGTYALTDKDGRWHAENIRPGTHVVQLDTDSLTDDYEVMTCEKNTRFAGRNYSQFVNVQGGSMWRADFHVQKKAVREMRLTQHLTAQREGDLIHVKVQLRGESDVRRVSSTFILPEGVQLVDGSQQLDGNATDALEKSDGILIMRLGAQQGAWDHAFTLDLQTTVTEPIKLAALARFNAPTTNQGINLPRTQVAVENATAEAESFAVIPAPVPHHESANVPGAQDRGVRDVRTSGDAIAQPVGSDSRDILVEQLPYDATWLATAQPGTEWLHPQESFLPSLPVIKVAVKLVPGQRATLMLNGEKVSPLYYDGAEVNAANTVSLATWRGVHIQDGDNKMEIIVNDENGKEVLKQSRNIHYAVTPDRVEFVPEHSRMIADGKTRPILALRFYDKDGYKMRRGVNGEFQINSPYESMNRLEADQRDPLGGKIDGSPRYEIGTDGIALIELAPTTQSGEVALNFTFGSDHKQEVKAWLEAGQRDWVLVGIGQGTLAHKQLSGNVTALKEAGADSELFDGDRLAFYAKGTVKGEYLLTMAYDTAKRQGDGGSSQASLQQAINPNQYYTLYADASQPYFDAASSSKLYLKIERKQFYALFGDFNTGLTVTEFSRYSRTVNGVKSEYHGDKFGYNAFATSTSQAYIKDEIQGDGTSGLYKLSRKNIVENTDKLRIETRDRFQSQVVVSSKTLSRYLDYDIDFNKGTVFFKEPVYARDNNFNPTFIVAEYESADPLDKNLTAGGRVSIKQGDKLETGLTLVRDGTQGASGNLGGVDATWQATDKTKVQAEIATSSRDLTGLALNGSAWKAEISHHEDKLDGKVYVREQQAGFGLGQQSASETGTRKIGGDARMKLSDTAEAQTQIYRQNTLGANDTQRDVVEARMNHKYDELTTYYGARYAGDTDNLGVSHSSKQVMGGAGYTFAQKFTVRAGGEASLGKAANTDYLDRINLGADYKLTEQTKLFAEQEFARGENISTDTARVGVVTQPWTGGAMQASLGNNQSLDSGRMYANLGMTQKWQINEFWQADAGIDKSQTLRNNGTLPLNPNATPANGSQSGDYTATGLGANYNDKVWGANTRIERRVSSTDEKLNYLLGFQRNLDEGRVMAAGMSYSDDQSAFSLVRSLNLRVSYASRPWDSDWVWMDRLDYFDERNNNTTISNTHLRKLVNNYNANWMVAAATQASLQYGSKYVLDNIDGVDFSGYTDLIGIELRHDLNEDWDIGAHTSLLHSWSASAINYGIGASLGYKFIENAWLVAGYNFKGFNDADFRGATYRAHGPYITLRMKIDQDTLKLNDKNGGLFARTK
ncbi:MAG: isopeptide-forming domain-containing fimbrial protein [Sideroxydans sp.]|nr:isopeptide-forming domain-containing fimbrial protein [Sideroxydans sp.]